MFQAELARRVGITKHRLSRIEAGKSQPPPDVFARIAGHLEVGMDRLIEVARRYSEAEEEQPAGVQVAPRPSGAYPEAPVGERAAVGARGDELGGIPVRRLVPVAVYGEVPAGDPDLADTAALDVRHIDPDMVRWIPGDAAKNSFWLQVRGDSMHERTDEGASLTDGDLILVCRDVACSDGEIGVVRLPEGGAAVKRIYRRNNRLLLVSTNPLYDPVELDEAYFVGAVMARWTPPEKFRRRTGRPPRRFH
jgi:SOS-response transcriptional repressor LexA